MSRIAPVLLVALLAAPGSALAGTWDTFGGKIPSGDTLQLEIGFPALPRFSYHHGVSGDFTVGGLFAFDYGYYEPDWAVRPSIVLGVPMRLSFQRSDYSVGLRLLPGVDFVFERGGAFLFGFLLNAAVDIGFEINDRIVVSAGVSMPMAAFFGDADFLKLPILFGASFELHATDRVALTFDLRAGPSITAGDGSDLRLGLNAMAGAVYRL